MIPDTISITVVVRHTRQMVEPFGMDEEFRDHVVMEHEEQTFEIHKNDVDTIVSDPFFLKVKLYDGTTFVENVDEESDWRGRIAQMANVCGLFLMSPEHVKLTNGWGVVGYQK